MAINFSENIEGLAAIELPVAPNDPAPLLAFVASAAASGVGKGVVLATKAVENGISAAANAPDQIMGKVQDIKVSTSIESPGQTPRSAMSPELAIQQPDFPPHVKGAAMSAAAPTVEMAGVQQGAHIEAAQLTGQHEFGTVAVSAMTVHSAIDTNIQSRGVAG